MAQRGRPRQQGIREPNGRLSRRPPDARAIMELNGAMAHWKNMVAAQTGHGLAFGAKHPLLHLVRLGKISADDFNVGTAWVATDFGSTPTWEFRGYLSDVTGLDFWSAKGCAKARQLAEKGLDPETVDLLDRAMFRGDIRLDELPRFVEAIDDLWGVWIIQV